MEPRGLERFSETMADEEPEPQMLIPYVLERKTGFYFVDSGCEAGASEYSITVDGEPAQELYTNGGPCESISRGVWFRLQGNQDTAPICVCVQRAGPEGIQVSAKVKSEERDRFKLS
jgi:hypothetical protein